MFDADLYDYTFIHMQVIVHDSSHNLPRCPPIHTMF